MTKQKHLNQPGRRVLDLRGSKDIVSGHLQGRHGLVDVLVQAVILHRVAGAQAVFPAPTLSQQEDLKKKRQRDRKKRNADCYHINLTDVQVLIK